MYLDPGGEDIVVNDEFELLRSHGHEIERFTVWNGDVDTVTIPGLVHVSYDAVFGKRYEAKLKEVLRTYKPDVAHVHNTFPLLSPMTFKLLHEHGCRVVATLHNYRFICANATFLRHGEICTKCLTGSKFNSVIHGCYRNSPLGSAVVSASSTYHSYVGTFKKYVDSYIVFTALSKEQFIKRGFPGEKFILMPKFVLTDPELLVHAKREKRFVFAGRMSEEKGLEDLLQAWEQVQPTDWHLTVAGEGPERDRLKARYGNLPNTDWPGWLERGKVVELAANSRYLAFPSKCFEQGPLVTMEAMSMGTPVLVRNLGPLPEIVRPEGAGMVFEDSGENDLAATLRKAMELPLEDWQDLSRRALEKSKKMYSPETSYEYLMKAYGLNCK